MSIFNYFLSILAPKLGSKIEEKSTPKVLKKVMEKALWRRWVKSRILNAGRCGGDGLCVPGTRGGTPLPVGRTLRGRHASEGELQGATKARDLRRHASEGALQGRNKADKYATRARRGEGGGLPKQGVGGG